MKYMGSKSALLRGALGELLLDKSSNAARFVDLFSGSGSVSHYIAENLDIPVMSVDLQHYSKVLSGGIIERRKPLSCESLVRNWISRAQSELENDRVYESLVEPIHRLGKATVLRSRASSQKVHRRNFITRDYGGYYYSPQQAYVLDRLYSKLPVNEPERSVCMSALLHAASVCAASPGHTAQPFQPNARLLPHIKAAWERDALSECIRHVQALAKRHAKVKGQAQIADAAVVASGLSEEDLAFCDPPYSAVQYSRFYHVLEGIARGGWKSVHGAGRSPSRDLRATSSFSMKTQATTAMSELLSNLRSTRCRVVITFPDADASNGLSSDDIIALSNDEWFVTVEYVESTHSTLGGTSIEGGRGGRRAVKEAILLLEPREGIISMTMRPLGT